MVPNLISNGQALPTVQVLLNGLQLVGRSARSELLDADRFAPASRLIL